ncbi:MAG: hypothetical protein GY805_22065 [Chloroflexi bacterium]|nr:hypothetical protein [Chloroflexota bacterium]
MKNNTPSKDNGLIIIAIAVTLLWGPETMAKFRWEKAGNLGEWRRQ